MRADQTHTVWHTLRGDERRSIREGLFPAKVARCGWEVCFEVFALVSQFADDGGTMQPHAIKVPVTARVSIECEFWVDDDGWNGRCSELSISVQGSGFEDAKRNMEEALTEHLLSLLRSTAKNVRAA